MKKILFLFFVIPLLGVTQVEEKPLEKKEVYIKRPTLEQQVQLKENELRLKNSRIKVGISELEN